MENGRLPGGPMLVVTFFEMHRSARGAGSFET